MPNAAAWLAQVVEDALEPEIPICDPHHHLWERPGDTYLVPDLLADLASGHNVVSTVFVECAAGYREEGREALRPVGETEFVERQVAAATAIAPSPGGKVNVAAGIVAYADLTLGAAVDEVLCAQCVASPGRLRGIRCSAAWDASPEIVGYRNPPPGRYLEPLFREGFARLVAHGLSFDAWQYHPQLAELALLGRDYPETTIIVDHCGAPLHLGPYDAIRDQVWVHWRNAIAMLARCENVVIKVGGLGQQNPALGLGKRPLPPTSAELATIIEPYVRQVIDTFGPARCMFESNFPVDKASYSYGVMWNAFKRVSACYTPAERADLFYGTAARAYRLGV
jgi:L-fuconolactonase